MRRTLWGTLALAATLAMTLAGCGETEFGKDPAPAPPPLDSTPPDDVTAFTATPGPNAGEVTLTWTPSISTDAVGYNLTITPAAGSPTTPPQITPASTTTFVATGLQTGVSHTFFLQTEDSSGNVSTGVTAVALPAALADVTGAVAIPGPLSGEVTLQWTASVSPGVTGYTVLVTPQGSPSLPVINVTPGSATGTLVTGLTNGTLHTFLITAIDGNNNQSAGVTVSATPTSATDTQPPTDISNLVAVPSGGQVSLTWSAATDNVGINTYTVTVSTPPPPAPSTSNGTTVVQTITLPGTITNGFPATPVVVTGLTNGTPYRFKVIAADLVGNTSPGGAPSFVDATPGSPATTVSYSLPGGAYRTGAAPSITLSGLLNGAPLTGGVIFYTLDGSNPVVSNASGTADGVTPTTPGATTLVQANGGGFIPIPLSAALSQRILGPLTAGAGSTAAQINGTFPVNGTVRTGDVVRITVQGSGGALVGETAAIANNGVSSTALLVGAGLSGAPATDTQYVIERTSRAVAIKAFFDPAGTVAPPATSAQAGVTGTARYFFFPGATAGTFVPYGGMVNPRFMHTATLMTTGPNAGGVAIFGGESAVGTNPPPSNPIEEFYDSNTEFFFRIGNPPFLPTLPVVRQEHVAVRLDNTDADILLAGGRRLSITGSIAADLVPAGARAAEIYDPLNNTFGNADGANFTPRTLSTADLLSRRVGGAVRPNEVAVIGGISTGAQTGFTALSTSGTGVVDLGAAPVISRGDILEVNDPTNSANGERVVVIDLVTAPVGASQRAVVSPSFTASVAGAVMRHVVIADRVTQFFDPQSGTWGAGPALQDRRWGHASVTLQNGLVFVAGGHRETPPISTNDIEKTTMILDPSTPGSEFWRYSDSTNTGNGFRNNSALLQSEKFFLTATLLKDGKVLVAGGIKDGSPFIGSGNYSSTSLEATADLFDPTNETTTVIGSLSGPRAWHSAVTLSDGRVLITGGANEIRSTGGLRVGDTAELYDPITRTFAPTSTMISARWGHQSTLMPDGRVLVTGGAGNSLPEVFDPATGLFSATAGTATGDRVIGGSAVLLRSGSLLVTGGQEPNQAAPASGGNIPGDILSISEVYETDLSNFRLSPNMSDARRFHSSTLLDDGRVVIVGGEGYPAGSAGASTTPVPLATIEIYDETTDTFTSGNSMSGGRFGHTATKLNPTVTHTTGTASFDGTTTVTGTGTTWLADGVAAGDRIRLDSDGNFFEIAAVTSNTTLTIRGAIGGFFPAAAIPGSVATPAAGAYTIYSENPYTIGTATFTFGFTGVTGTGTFWTRTVRAGDLIRPTGAGMPATTYVVQTVVSDTSLTLATAYTGQTVTGSAYTCSAPGRLLVVGGGPTGAPLNTGELFEPTSGNWSSISNKLALGRFEHTATLLSNGWVLIVGGAGNFDRTAELFDPAMNRFTQISLPAIGTAVTQAARNNHSASLLGDGNVFIAGGDVGQSAVELFVTDSDANAAADADGDGFAFLDFNQNTFRRFFAGATSPNGEAGPSMSVGRVAHRAIVLPASGVGTSVNRILLIGGKSGANSTADLYDYQGVGQTSTNTGGIALARAGMTYHMAIAMPGNNNVLIIHGHTAQIFFSQ